MSGPPPLEVRSLRVDFGGLRALDDVSLTVPRSAIVGLIGPNGAGKTTLFDCITGIVRPTRGQILLFGRNVTAWPPHRRMRLGVGRTFQRLELFGSLSVAENLIVALEAKTTAGTLRADLLRSRASVTTRRRWEAKAAEILELVGLTDHAGARAADLPIGLSRLAELARALCTDPKLLLLDEPSSGLTEAESERLAATIRTIRDEGGRSALIVEHDMAFVLGSSDHVHVLDFGRMIAEGSPAEVRRDPAVQAAYLGEEVEDGAAPGA